jgi:hypothetical protein
MLGEKDRQKYDQHLDLHESKRKQFGLPSLEEVPCEFCEKGLEMKRKNRSSYPATD